MIPGDLVRIKDTAYPYTNVMPCYGIVIEKITIDDSVYAYSVLANNIVDEYLEADIEVMNEKENSCKWWF